MSNVFSANSIVLPNGISNIPQSAMPANSTTMLLTLGRCTTATPTVWPNTNQSIHVDLQFSYDGAASWQVGGSFDSSGGIVSFHGHEVTESTGTWIYAVGPTHLRGTVQVTNGPILTSVNVDIT